MTDANVIDNMSTEDLNAALKSELNQLDGKADAEPVVQPEPEVKQKDQEVATQDSEVKTDGDDGVDDGTDNPYRKRVDRLLRKRDILEDKVSEKDQRIAQLESQLANREADNKDDDDAEVEPEKDISKVINKVLDEREGKTKSDLEKMKLANAEFDALVKSVPNANDRKTEILELAEKYPTLTFEAIDRILSPADHSDPIENNRKNAKRMDVSAHSRADLEDNKDMSKASPADQEKYLREQIASGKFVI